MYQRIDSQTIGDKTEFEVSREGASPGIRKKTLSL